MKLNKDHRKLFSQKKIEINIKNTRNKFNKRNTNTLITGYYFLFLILMLTSH